MEVPESMLKRGGSLPGRAAFLSFEGQAARMATPGAAMSGYTTTQINHINICVEEKKQGQNVYYLEKRCDAVSGAS